MSGRKDYTLSLLRVVSHRLKQINEEVMSIGIALSADMITPEKACQLCEAAAPGCLDVVALDLLQGGNA